jgi:hypothetical protein
MVASSICEVVTRCAETNTVGTGESPLRSVVMIGLAMRTDVRKHRTLPTIAPSSPISRMHIGIK